MGLWCRKEDWRLELPVENTFHCKLHYSLNNKMYVLGLDWYRGKCHCSSSASTTDGRSKLHGEHEYHADEDVGRHFQSFQR